MINFIYIFVRLINKLTALIFMESKLNVKYRLFCTYTWLTTTNDKCIIFALFTPYVCSKSIRDNTSASLQSCAQKSKPGKFSYWILETQLTIEKYK